MISYITAEHTREKKGQSGFTLIELLVSITIVGILTAIILPAIQQARESARKISCKNNLHQIGIAIHDYEAKFGILPPGRGKRFGWLVEILPQMEQGHLYNKADFSKDVWGSENKFLRNTYISTYACPSDAETRNAIGAESYPASYAGNYSSGFQKYGYNGIFLPLRSSWEQFPAGRIRLEDITDGLSNTAAVGEILVGDGSGDLLRTLWATPRRIEGADQLDEFASFCASMGPKTPGGAKYGLGNTWISGDAGQTWYNHVNTPNKPSCLNQNDVIQGCYSAASLHIGGVNVLYADGHVQFTSEIIDLQTWRALASRNGAEDIRNN